MTSVRVDTVKKKHVDVATAITVFLAREVYGDADAVVERVFSVSPHSVNSVVGKLVVPYIKNRLSGRRVSLKTLPMSLVIHALLRTGVLRAGEDGLVVNGRSIRDVATAIFGSDIAGDLEKYLLTIIASDRALLSTVLGSSEQVPSWLINYVSEHSPVGVALDAVVTNKNVWSRLTPEQKLTLFKRISNHCALTVLWEAPWAIDSKDLFIEALSNLVRVKLPSTATELIARYAPEVVGEVNPVLEEVGSVKLMSKPPALVRVDILYGLSPESYKEFTVFDTRTKIGIVVLAKTVSEAVESAYSNLLDSYLEFREVVSELDEYSKMYGCKLVKADEVVGEFRLPGISIYNVYDTEEEYVFTIPLQVGFRSAFESALKDVRSGVTKKLEETTNTSKA